MSPTRRHMGFHHIGFSCCIGLTFCAIPAVSSAAGPALAQEPGSTAPGLTEPAPKQAKPVKPASPKSAAAAQGAATPPIPGEPTWIAGFGDWGTYTATPNGKKVCFALAKPASSSTAPPNRPRDQPWMFISSRPGEKVSNEVSVVFGYPLKPGSDATIEIAGGSYAMNTQGDGAWVKNPAEEPKLVETLRKGLEVTVKGTSAKGTVSTDVYSLKGLAQALDRVGKECR
jgi:invasion protein IalB